MSSLNAIPGYTEAEAAYWQASARFQTVSAQRDAAINTFGINSSQVNQYQQQLDTIVQQQENAAKILAQISESAAGTNADLASPVVTTSQSQSTPATVASGAPASANDDAPAQAPTSGGVGAGTGSNGNDSRGDDNPPASSNTAQQTINQTFANQPITPQPNALDRYASYTYAISWWLLTPEQFNASQASRAPAPNTGNWTLLCQSGGAPVGQRNPSFPVDFYIDDLEIETYLMGKGTGMSTNAADIRFKVIEPNGLTLIQRLFEAVVNAYKNPSAATSPSGTASTVNTNVTAVVPNYASAIYALTIQFYGYDSQGNLAAPARGQYSIDSQPGNNNPQAVIRKYFPFLLQNITFRTVANQIEYLVVGKPVPYSTGTSQARGTIPFAFSLAGTTVAQVLSGSPISGTDNSDPGSRTPTTAPSTIENLEAGDVVQQNTVVGA